MILRIGEIIKGPLNGDRMCRTTEWNEVPRGNKFHLPSEALLILNVVLFHSVVFVTTSTILIRSAKKKNGEKKKILINIELNRTKIEICIG